MFPQVMFLLSHAKVKIKIFSACGQLRETIAVRSISQGDLASLAKTRRTDLPSGLASVSELYTNTLSSESKRASGRQEREPRFSRLLLRRGSPAALL